MLYVTRHGQTTWNVENKLCGRAEAELTELGRQQAANMGDRLAKDLAGQGVQLDRMIVSPLKRAQDTALLAAQGLGFPQARIETDLRLTELSFGVLEGAPIDGVEHSKLKHEFALRFPEGESLFDVAARVYALLDELRAGFEAARAEGRPEPNVLLVCHGATARVINSYFEGSTNDAYFDWSLGNAEVRSYRL